MTLRPFAALGACVLVACGGTSSLTAPGQSQNCQVSIGGNVTYGCKPATTVWDSGNNTGGFTFQVTKSSINPGISVTIGFPGEPAAKTYKSTDSGAAGSLSLTSGSGVSTQTWVATAGGGTPTGSYTLTFNSVSGAVTVPQGKAYDGEGALDAVLKSTSGGADVTLHADF